MEMGIKPLIDTSSSNAFQFWVLRLHPYNNINVIAENSTKGIAGNQTDVSVLVKTKQTQEEWVSS